MKTKKLKVKSKTENLSLIRDFVSTAALDAGVQADVVENIILAVDEACTNIIKHAYQSFPDGELIIKTKSTLSRFVVSITDYGKSFEPKMIPEPDLQKYYRQKRVGGLGMYLMKTLMDDVKYVSVPGKYNEVLLSKNIKMAQTNAR
ncbi:MAG TPA: ATP-binding protein [Ignavibacteriaceae bacterium]|nr:ATP-binding protein [Ignavibacteriaceae bacterium]